jgi:hypothetical protein
MPYTELQITLCIADVKSGVYASQRAAAAAYNIPESTLRARLASKASERKSAHQHQQRLTPAQEEFIADWVLEEDARGYAPTHARTREMAQRLLRANGDLRPLGKKWVTTFIHRNPRVSSVVGRRIEASRIIGTSPTHIQDFFTRLSRVQTENQVRGENTWNMDEHGIALGICTNTRVLASASKKRTYVAAPQDRE